MILRSISPIVLVGFLIIQSTTVRGQDVTNSRQAMLMEGNYMITGTAFLEKLSDGGLRLRLSEDYSTPAGPDVQIFLPFPAKSPKYDQRRALYLFFAHCGPLHHSLGSSTQIFHRINWKHSYTLLSSYVLQLFHFDNP